MGERVPSDHDTVSSYRIPVESVGRTSRLRLALPSAVPVAAGDVLRLTLDGRDAHAQVTDGIEGGLQVRGAYDNARLARETDADATDRLREWLSAADRSAGQSVLLDELVAGDHYGLRAPGERVVYTVKRSPSGSLSDIAEDLGE
ncbi:hypothetical protein GJ629_14160 [Halapricum sp. CBA1109]|uniref:DUF7112 family protein n=1 Tax=Halapricum sp. CBA1109 TaxID=2668068 RepID=UPI0012FB2B89|nr:hypothetical protein [Halapricum sp. CBA1109]MUV90896.1 hypothetical protein [Halapricum sp. CBA1109]